MFYLIGEMALLWIQFIIPGQGSVCAVLNTIPVIFSSVHTYSNNGNYTISCIDGYRIANIKNITNSSAEKMFLQYQLTISPFLGNNNSAVSTACPFDQVQCCDWQYNSGAYDSDGDSLAYILVPPFTSNYSFPNGSFINSIGTLSFSATSIGQYAFSLKIEEWRKIGLNNYLVGNSFREVLLEVTSLVSVKDIFLVSTHIITYPNPVSNTLHIESEQYFAAGSAIEITNALGQTVLKLSYDNEIDVSNISNGCYFLKITTNNNERFHSKFVKQ